MVYHSITTSGLLEINPRFRDYLDLLLSYSCTHLSCHAAVKQLYCHLHHLSSTAQSLQIFGNICNAKSADPPDALLLHFCWYALFVALHCQSVKALSSYFLYSCSSKHKEMQFTEVKIKVGMRKPTTLTWYEKMKSGGFMNLICFENSNLDRFLCQCCPGMLPQ